MLQSLKIRPLQFSSIAIVVAVAVGCSVSAEHTNTTELALQCSGFGGACSTDSDCCDPTAHYCGGDGPYEPHLCMTRAGLGGYCDPKFPESCTGGLACEMVDDVDFVCVDPYPHWSCDAPYAPPATRDAALWPFASSSPFNTPMGSGAVFENATDACTTSFKSNWAKTMYADIASTSWSQPVWIAQPSDPTVTLMTGATTFAMGVNCPSNAVPADPIVELGGDANLNIIDPTHAFLFESWKAQPDGAGVWTANYWYQQSLLGSGINGGVRAGATSTIGGLIRSGEFKSVIEHAIGFAIDTSAQQNAFVPPAISNDVCKAMPCAFDPDYTGSMPMGQLLAIPPSVNLCTLNLTPGGFALARALQDFGAFLTDSSKGTTFYAEPTIASDPTESQMLSDAISDLNAIIVPGDYLRCATNGAGLARAPSAPPIE